MAIDLDIAVRASAAAMITLHGGGASVEAARQVSFRISANDFDGALAMDRIRRAIVHMTGL